MGRSSSSEVESAFHRRLEILLITLTAALAATSGWLSRNSMNPDGIAYLDLSDHVLAGHPEKLVNGYWSPLYPLFLAMARRIINPSREGEFAVVHLVNVIALLLSLAAFRWFLHRSIEHFGLQTRRTSFLLWGYGLFAWSAIAQISLETVTPDMFVSGFAYLAAGMVLLLQGRGRTASFMLGLCCALGYLTKSVMLPISMGYLIASLPRRGLPSALAAFLAGFLVLAGPWIAMLSLEKERATFGDTGRLAYGLFVNGTQYYTHWQGEPPGSGIPAHPTRRIPGAIEMYEFATPVVATYPPWGDPSYWNEGLRVWFSFDGHLRALVQTLRTYYVIFFKTQWAFAFLTALALLAFARRTLVRGVAEGWRILFPAVWALSIYAVLHVEGRYVGPFVVALLLGILVATASSLPPRLLLLFSIPVVLSLYTAAAVEVIKQAPRARSQPEEWRLVEAMRGVGLQEGDRIASVGLLIGHSWPRLAGARVVAEVPDRSILSFWRADEGSRRLVLNHLRKLGVRAVVARGAPCCEPMRWIALRDDWYILFLE